MDSSISSSSRFRPARNGVVWRSVACAAAAFVVCCAVVPRIDFSVGGWRLLEQAYMASDMDEPPLDEWGYVYDGKNELSHLLMYHDLWGCVEPAREADVFLLGNSNLLLGLRYRHLQGDFTRAGVKPFYLAFGHGDKIEFARDLICKYDLRPRLVIMLAEPRYVRGGYSDWAREVMHTARWDAWKQCLERTATWHVSKVVYRVLPYCNIEARMPKGVLYRNWRHGAWWMALEPVVEKPFTVPEGPAPVMDEAFVRAEDLHGEIQRRGGELVLVAVPTPDANLDFARRLAGRLGVPLIEPRERGWATFDDRHLTRAESRRFCRMFWENLRQLPVVQRLWRDDTDVYVSPLDAEQERTKSAEPL